MRGVGANENASDTTNKQTAAVKVDKWATKKSWEPWPPAGREGRPGFLSRFSLPLPPFPNQKWFLQLFHARAIVAVGICATASLQRGLNLPLLSLSVPVMLAPGPHLQDGTSELRVRNQRYLQWVAKFPWETLLPSL